MKDYTLFAAEVCNTGWPIDGAEVVVSLYANDPGYYHLEGWQEGDDTAVAETMWQTAVEAGFSCDTKEEFMAAWKAKEWEPPAAFCLEKNQVKILEVLGSDGQ